MPSYVPANLEAVLTELRAENDRAVAIVGAALIEHYLEEAIKFQLRSIDVSTTKGKEELDRLYGANGIFSGISAKIVGAFAMQIIGPSARRDLEIINKIRNQFAHDMNPIQFSSESVKSRCNELWMSQDIAPEFDLPRERYIRAVRMYMTAFWLVEVAREEPDAKDDDLLKRLAS